MVKQSESQIIGRAGERWFQSLIPREWIFQRPEEDIGLDGKVTIGTTTTAGGLEFGVQVKASNNWDIKDGVISVGGIKTDTLIFWGSRLYPTLLVLYDVAKDAGYYGWASDIISSAIELHVPYSQEIGPKTVTLKVLASSVLTKHTLLEMGSDVETYYINLVGSLAAIRKSINILPIVNKLVKSVRGLHLSHAQPAKTEEQQMLLDIMMFTSHKNVIEALRALQDRYNIQGGTQHFIEYFISNYINEVSKVIHDFASVLDKAESFAVSMNQESNERITPMLIDMILDFILLLTDDKPEERGTVFSFA